MEFEFKDRRGENKAAAETPSSVAVEGHDGELNISGPVNGKLEVVKREPKGALTWKSVGYTYVYLNVNGQSMMAGRAVGLRSDEKMFTADWMIAPVVSEDEVWQKDAKRRLDTFKACSCSPRGRCEFHGQKCAGQVSAGDWIKEDIERIQKVQSTPLPEALEILMKAEMARQNARIVTPGR